MHLRSLFFLFITHSLVSGSNSRESAWNGHVSPGSDVPSRFYPYYVPPGAKSYDSSSPLIRYSGHWMDSYSGHFVDTTLRRTSAPHASASLTFTGTGIEWFGNTDRMHGIARVYIDGRRDQDVNSWSLSSHKQQRLYWKFGLPNGKHTIKVVNMGRGHGGYGHAVIDVDAFVVTQGPGHQTKQTALAVNALERPSGAQLSSTEGPSWNMRQQGSTGVAAMQLAIISPSHALIIDKVEHNPLTIDGHPAWAALYNLETHAVRPLRVGSNSFCAGGSFLGNGTLVSVGGNPVVEDHTSAADFGDVDGLQAVRLFHPCLSESAEECEIYENHARVRMTSPRWYPTVLRVSDGSAMIIGGSKKGGWINNATVNNPTIEYWPPKAIHGSKGLPIHLPFLVDTLNSNLFPMAFALPDDRIFMAANRDAMIYNWRDNKEQRLPQLPNGVRVTYPMAGTCLLLPLSSLNDYTPEILLCGGSTIDDQKASYEISSQDSASNQCLRMVLSDNGITAGWEVEFLPEARVMPDAVLLPTGQVLIVNGGRTGMAGYGNVIDKVGESNADNPVLSPVLYDPAAPKGQRFSSAGMPSSSIPRLYHSVATLTPNGDVMIAGSNPNLDRSEIAYGTEYRVEWIAPPYMTQARPHIMSHPDKLAFGTNIELGLQLAAGQGLKVEVVLMDLGFVTHGVHANSRLVHLVSSLKSDRKTLSVTGPPNAKVYPPGPGFIYVLVDGVPSAGVQIMVGDGSGPEVDHEAWDNLLRTTTVDQYEALKKHVGKRKHY